MFVVDWWNGRIYCVLFFFLPPILLDLEQWTNDEEHDMVVIVMHTQIAPTIVQILKRLLWQKKKTKFRPKNADIRFNENPIIFGSYNGCTIRSWFSRYVRSCVECPGAHGRIQQRRRRQQMLSAVKRTVSTSLTYERKNTWHPLLANFPHTESHNWQTDSNLYNRIVQILPPTVGWLFFFFHFVRIVCLPLTFCRSIFCCNSILVGI